MSKLDKDDEIPFSKKLVRVNPSTLTRWSETKPSEEPQAETTEAPPSEASPPSASSSDASSPSSASAKIVNEDLLSDMPVLDVEEVIRRKKAEEDAKRKREEESRLRKPRHATNMKLNEKLILWKGDLCGLEVDAVVNTTNERVNDQSGVSGRIFYHGGSDLLQECSQTDGCPTGDAIVTKGYNLPAKWVIHTVGPRYSVKYQTAAENALHGCYRRSLELLKDQRLTSIAFPAVNTDRKGYPKMPAVHIAFRTVRRFLELYGDGIATVVFAVTRTSDEMLYQQLLPLYFPRSVYEEQLALRQLPPEAANELGETIIPERQIRITTTSFFSSSSASASSSSSSNGNGNGSALTASASDGNLARKAGAGASAAASNGTFFAPSSAPAGSGQGSPTLGGSSTAAYQDEIAKDAVRDVPGGFEEDKTSLSSGDFSAMQENPDVVRRKNEALKPKDQLAREENERQYNNYLARAKEENLQDLIKLNFIYPSGVDSQGRPVVIFVASHFPANADLDKLLLCLIKVLDPIVSQDYNVIYFHTNSQAQNRPPYEWFKQVYNIFNRKYKKNMKRLFIVHPNFWVKLGTFFAQPFVSKKFWGKLIQVPRLMELYEHFDPKTLKIPKSILIYDQEENGAFYASRIESGDRKTGRKEDDEL